MGSGRVAGRVGSDFLSEVAGRVGSGRVNVSPGRVGSGSRKVTRGQLCNIIFNDCNCSTGFPFDRCQQLTHMAPITCD